MYLFVKDKATTRVKIFGAELYIARIFPRRLRLEPEHDPSYEIGLVRKEGRGSGEDTL